jgi:hypothetical protein
LFDVSTTDGVTSVGVPIAFVLVAMIASLVPAWRASRLDPNVVLRRVTRVIQNARCKMQKTDRCFVFCILHFEFCISYLARPL